MRLPQGGGDGRDLESFSHGHGQWRNNTSGNWGPWEAELHLGPPSQGSLLWQLPRCWRTECFHKSFQRKMTLHILSLEDFALSVTWATVVSSRLLAYHIVTPQVCSMCVCARVHSVTQFCTQPCRSFPTLGLSTGPASGSITSWTQANYASGPAFTLISGLEVCALISM